MRQKFRPDGAAHCQADTAAQSDHRDTDHHHAVMDRPGQTFPVLFRKPDNRRIVPLGCFFLEEEADEDRGNGHGENHGAQQREPHGPGHGLEQASFHALEGEDRQIAADDDGDGVEDGPLHLVGSGPDPVFHG